MPETQRNCSQCGSLVPDGHHYCGRCGAFYSEDGADVQNETAFFGAMQAPGRAKLILIRGEGETSIEGLSYHLNATKHIVGRNQGKILFPEDSYMSNKHATFLYRENKLYMRDEESLNGTYLKLRESRDLEDGDIFMIGEQVLRVEYLNLQKEYPAQEDTLMYISPPKDYKFRLVHIIRGGKPGATYCSVNNDILIGREGCDVNFGADRYASRQHARVTWQDGKVVLRDMNSKNGTFIQLKGEERIRHNDYVHFGSELMRVEINS